MKNKRNILFASILGLLSFGAAAQDTDVTVFVNPSDITVENGKARIEIWYESDLDRLNWFNFDIYIPKGFEIEKNSRDQYKFTVNPDEDVVYNHGITAGEHFEDADNPYYTIMAGSMSNAYLAPGKNMVFWFSLIVPESFTAEAYPEGAECHLGKISITNNIVDENGYPQGYHPADFYFRINPDIITGIDGATVDGEDDAIYNLNGLRVYPPLAPGVYISNGEKIIVK